MQIRYLKTIHDWLLQHPREAKGLSELRISSLESNIGKTLPLAYKEFLYLGGEYYNGIDRIGFKLDDLEEHTWPMEKEWFASANLSMDRDYLVFGEEGGGAYFFYLDEGNDPPFYVLEFDSDDPEIRKIHDTFSGFVEYHFNFYLKFKFDENRRSSWWRFWE